MRIHNTTSGLVYSKVDLDWLIVMLFLGSGCEITVLYIINVSDIAPLEPLMCALLSNFSATLPK